MVFHTYEAINTYLLGQAVNDENTPYTIKLAEDIPLIAGAASTQSVNFYKIAYNLTANNMGGTSTRRYVVLDLSVVPITRITGSNSTSYSNEYYIKHLVSYADKNVVGIILPNTLTFLINTFNGITSIKWVKIPNSLGDDASGFKSTAFTGSSITKLILGGTSYEFAADANGLTNGASFITAYNNANPKSGTYELNGATWTKTN